MADVEGLCILGRKLVEDGEPDDVVVEVEEDRSSGTRGRLRTDMPIFVDIFLPALCLFCMIFSVLYVSVSLVDGSRLGLWFVREFWGVQLGRRDVLVAACWMIT